MRLAPTVAVMFGLFLVGIALERAGALSPIHEQFHVDAARELGYTITERTHNSVKWRGGNHSEVILAGYWREMLLYSSLALILGRWGTLFAGYLASTIGEAPISTDFRVYLYDHLVTNAGWPGDRALAAVQRNLDAWDRAALIVAILLLARYAFTLYRVHSKEKGRPGVSPPVPAQRSPDGALG
tara:strand:- start:126 stop:677 length:552 start_codon:yes stop_codon:yes gene_type:complete